MTYDRQTVVRDLATAMHKADMVLALWESGSEVFGRTDEYSDIDLEAIIVPGQLEAMTQLARLTLSIIAPISHEYQQRTSDGGVQFFWQCMGVPALNYVDMTFTEQKNVALRLGAHGEGKPIIHFDKCGCLDVREETLEEMRWRVRQRVNELAATFNLHPCLVEKHIVRGHVLHAYGQYQRVMISPLIELLRIKYCPQRSSWQTTYIQWDLPVEIQERLRPLVMVNSLEEMAANLPVIMTWGQQLIAELKEC